MNSSGLSQIRRAPRYSRIRCSCRPLPRYPPSRPVPGQSHGGGSQRRVAGPETVMTAGEVVSISIMPSCGATRKLCPAPP